MNSTKINEKEIKRATIEEINNLIKSWNIYWKNWAKLVFKAFVPTLEDKEWHDINDIIELEEMWWLIADHKDGINDFIQISKDNEHIFLSFNLECNLLNKLLKDWNILQAETLVDKMGDYYNWKNYNNQIAALQDRIQDRKDLGNAISWIDNKLEKERFKIIEILWFFVAITAFIFTWVEVMKNYNYFEARKIIILMADILLLFEFILVLMFLNYNKEKFKTAIIIMAILWLLAILLFLY